MKEERHGRGLVILAGMVACVALGIYWDRYARPPAPKPADAYEFFDPLVDLRAQIVKNYVEPVDEKRLLQGAIDGMLSELDPYTNYFSKDEFTAFDRSTHGQFSGIGAEMSQDPQTGQIFVVSPLEDSPALKAGIYAGDRILKISGDVVDGVTMKDLMTKLTGPPGSTLPMLVLHEGDKTPTEVVVKRAVITVQSVKGYKHDDTGGWDCLIDPEHRIAYVRITNFMENTAEEMDKLLLPLFNSPKGLRGIILDLRFDPGGLLSAAIGVSDRFLDSGVIVSTRGRNPQNDFVARATKEFTYPNTPLVVLINEYSASASEIVAGALKDHGRAVLVGTRSFGKGSVQNLITLDGGQHALKITTAYYYLPSGRNIMRKKGATTWGVDPDPAFVIPMTDEEKRELLRMRARSEIIRIHRPVPVPVAGHGDDDGASNEAQATTQAAESPDRQLQRAVDVLIAHQEFQGLHAVAETVTTSRPSVTASTGPGTLPEPADVPTPSTAPASAPSETAPAASQPSSRLPDAPDTDPRF